MQGRECDPRIWTNTDVQLPVKDMARMKPNTSAGLEKNMEHNLTSGSVVKNIAKFSLPYLLSFAAGAMLYVVVEELIPEMSQGEHSDVGTIFFAVGFSVMMMLDVALG